MPSSKTLVGKLPLPNCVDAIAESMMREQQFQCREIFGILHKLEQMKKTISSEMETRAGFQGSCKKWRSQSRICRTEEVTTKSRVMAGYGDGDRGYSTYNTPSSDDNWSETSYAPDHVCRPVLIDADGRKRPIISYGANQNPEHYFTKTETIFQQHVSPLESEYKHVSHSTEDPYGAENKFRRPLTSVNGRPPIVEEFITKVQADASRAKADPWDASHRRQSPKFKGYDGYTDGYDEHNGFHNQRFRKSNGRAHRNDNYDDYYRRQGSNMEPNMNTGGGWGRPSHSTWAAPPNASLSGATNDIGAAAALLKEVAKPSVTTSPQYRYREPAYKDAIDSKEAARRYGNFNFSSRPYARDDSFTPTIDSREAARKYRGSEV
ncbi:unnamed protein product [Dovyalis caffra]|uniref:Uncharacterized protein n=1 Tax=Dovyalis caffra TaxID=77055 RepID=A0AAV1RW48_9ROSI|nr:unnamed protein product [Dovyalis caffra]